MNDVEQAMKQRQQMGPNNHSSQSVPQFFQNAANNFDLRNNQHLETSQANYRLQANIPTQEQLQQHTSEIMRNAILRKNQQNHDEKFQK